MGGVFRELLSVAGQPDSRGNDGSALSRGEGRNYGAPWESLQYYPLRDFWCDGKQMISA